MSILKRKQKLDKKRKKEKNGVKWFVELGYSNILEKKALNLIGFPFKRGAPPKIRK